MRNVLHDYPDAKCLTLLQKTVAAMSSDSFLLLDEIVIPDKGVHPRATEMDLVMMTTLAAMERTRKHWNTLFQQAGLTVVSSIAYNKAVGESLQILRRS